MEFFDSHAHYNDSRFDGDRNTVIEDAFREGVTRIINSGYNMASSEEAIKISKLYDFVYSSVGISPNDLIEFENEVIIDDIPVKDKEVIKGTNIEHLYKLSRNPKMVAIGEIGLDYYWNKDNKEFQKDIFKAQIKLANRCKLPIIIHSRDAYIDTIEVLKEQKCDKAGVFHCCALNLELIKDALELGYYISFAGPITYSNSKNADEVINFVPMDRILIETDCPYLSPEPNRGERNDSRNLKYMAGKIANVKKIRIEEVARATYENACKVFNIV